MVLVTGDVKPTVPALSTIVNQTPALFLRRAAGLVASK
jgi:hypothetical protein